MIPEGSYNAEIIEVTPKTSRAGNEMFEVKMNIDHEGEGTHVWDYIVHSLEWKMDSARKSVGLGPDDEVTVESLIGRWVQVRINHETYDGKTRPKVKAWTGPGEADTAQETHVDEGEEDDYPI